MNEVTKEELAVAQSNGFSVAEYVDKRQAFIVEKVIFSWGKLTAFTPENATLAKKMGVDCEIFLSQRRTKLAELICNLKR